MTKKRLLFSSIDNGYTYKDYKEYCEDYNMEVGTEWSWDYLNWKNEMTEEDWGDLIANIKCSKNNGRCIITGTLGLWWGSPQIEEVECESLVEAINKCNQNDYIEVYENEEDGSCEVHSIHHDGTNVFHIYPIKGGKRGKYPKYLF